MSAKLRRAMQRVLALPGNSDPGTGPVTGPGPGLLTMFTSNGSATADLGVPLTAKLAKGVRGKFAFTKIGQAIKDAVAIGTQATYSPVLADQGQRVDAEATDLSFSVGLTPSRNTSAILSFYGSMTAAGSTLTAQLIAGFTGTIVIRRGNGSVAATVNAASLASYVLSSGDLALGPFTATASDLVLTIEFSNVAGTTLPHPFARTHTVIYGSQVGAGDSFFIRLQAGVRGIINFSSNGTVVTDTQVIDNALSYIGAESDAGHTIRAVISNLVFQAGEVYVTPVLQSGTVPPFLYGVQFHATQRNKLRLVYLPLNNLDPASLPSPSDFSITGAARTVLSVSVDNSEADYKYVDLILNENGHRDERYFLNYTGTAIKYIGGQPAATLANQGVFNNGELRVKRVYPSGTDAADQTQPAGTILMNGANPYVVRLTYTRGDSGNNTVTEQGASVEMSILPDWGTNTGIMRQVSFDYNASTYGGWDIEQFSCRRYGNTVRFFQRSNFFSPQNLQSEQVGPAYTFANAGPLCKARLILTTEDFLVRMQVSENAGDSWVTVATATQEYRQQIMATAYSNQTAIPVTDVATTRLPKSYAD